MKTEMDSKKEDQFETKMNERNAAMYSKGLDFQAEKEKEAENELSLRKNLRSEKFENRRRFIKQHKSNKVRLQDKVTLGADLFAQIQAIEVQVRL